MNPLLSPLSSLLARSWHLTSDIWHLPFFRSQEHDDCFTISLLLSKKRQKPCRTSEYQAWSDTDSRPFSCVYLLSFQPTFFSFFFFSFLFLFHEPVPLTLLFWGIKQIRISCWQLAMLPLLTLRLMTHAATHDSCCNATSTLIDESEPNPKSETKTKSKRRKAKVKMPRPRLRLSKRAAAAAPSVSVSARPTRQGFQVQSSKIKFKNLVSRSSPSDLSTLTSDLWTRINKRGRWSFTSHHITSVSLHFFWLGLVWLWGYQYHGGTQSSWSSSSLHQISTPQI